MNNKLVTETVLFNNIIRTITVVCQNSILTQQETMHFYTMWFKTVAINDNSFGQDSGINKSCYDFYDKIRRF